LKNCPTATLRVCYGWHVFDKKLSTTLFEYRQGLLELKDQINELGLPQKGGQVLGAHGCKFTGFDGLLVVVDWA
jgi:hypothetical protein